MKLLGKSTLRFKLTIYITLVFCVGITTIVILISKNYASFVDELFFDRTEEELEVLSHNLKGPLAAGDLNSVRKNLETHKVYEEYISLSIRLTDGSILLREQFRNKGNRGNIVHLQKPIINDIGESLGVLLVEVTMDNIMIEFQDNIKKIILLAFAVLIMTLTFVVYIVREALLPLIILQRAFDNIIRGEYDTTLEVSSDDEIGKLSNAFNEMSLRLKETSVSRDVLLEEMEGRKKMEEALRHREKELEKYVSELERFNKLTVDRELRMKELKEEIVQLKKDQKIS